VDVEIIWPLIPHCSFNDDVINKSKLSIVETDKVDNVGHDESVGSCHIIKTFKRLIPLCSKDEFIMLLKTLASIICDFK
jgi:hypothetical protein